MRREEYNRGGIDYETRDRDYNRDYDRDEFNQGYPTRTMGYGQDPTRGAYGRNFDRDYDRNYMPRERGINRDFDEDRGFGYGRSYGYQGHFGYGPESTIGQNWAGRNYSPSGYGGDNYRYGQGMPMGMGMQGGMQHPSLFSQTPFFGHRNDDEIEHEIYDRLDNDWQIPDNADIHAKVDDGVITLTGQVRNRNAKMAAGNCAWQIPGVEDVHNNIAIQSRRRQNQTGSSFGSSQYGQTSMNQTGSQSQSRGSTETAKTK